MYVPRFQSVMFHLSFDILHQCSSCHIGFVQNEFQRTCISPSNLVCSGEKKNMNAMKHE